MTVNKARKILNESGIYWTNYFDLCGIMDKKDIFSPLEIEATQVLMNFLIRG